MRSAAVLVLAALAALLGAAVAHPQPGVTREFARRIAAGL